MIIHGKFYPEGTVVLTRDKLEPDTLYFVSSSEQYAFSPDGVGLYWYDTELEVLEQHGQMPVTTVDVIGD